MKLKNPMLVVKDIDKSVEFYKQIFSLHVIMDFGANKTLTGGLALQTEDTYKDFIGREIQFGGNDAEIYFEESDFDGFIEKLKGCDVEYVHPAIEHTWGQRVVRLYDPDRHIIDVGKDDALLSKKSIKGSAIRRNAILDLIRSNPAITIPEIAIIQKVSARTIERDFDWLKDRGIIIREGSRADGRWIIVE